MPDSCSPIFIVGAPRSGTTLLRLMLNANSKIAIPEETWFFPNLFKPLPDLLKSPDWRSNIAEKIINLSARHFPNWQTSDILPDLENLEKQDISNIIASLNRAFARKEGKNRWGDKTPGYILHLQLLYRLWPNAYVIHMIRDPRDVVPSILKYWEVGPQTHDPLEVIWYWKKHVKKGRKEGPKYFGDRYLEVRFEDLVANPEIKLREICRHIKAEYEPDMLNYYKTAEQYTPPWEHHESTNKPVNTSLTYKWKYKEAPMPYQTFFAVTSNKLLEKLGYQKASITSIIDVQKVIICFLKKKWAQNLNKLKVVIYHLVVSKQA